MSDEPTLADLLAKRDSSAFMDGAANWVVPAHPDTGEPGQIIVHIPWQAVALLGRAVKALREAEHIPRHVWDEWAEWADEPGAARMMVDEIARRLREQR